MAAAAWQTLANSKCDFNMVQIYLSVARKPERTFSEQPKSYIVVRCWGLGMRFLMKNKSEESGNTGRRFLYPSEVRVVSYQNHRPRVVVLRGDLIEPR